MKSKLNNIFVAFIVIVLIAGCGTIYGKGKTKKFRVGIHWNNVFEPSLFGESFRFGNFGFSYYLNKKFFIQIILSPWSEVKGFQSKLGYTLFDSKDYLGMYFFCDLYAVKEDSNRSHFYPVLGIGILDHFSPMALNIFFKEKPFQLNWYLGYVLSSREIFKNRRETFFAGGIGLEFKF